MKEPSGYLIVSRKSASSGFESSLKRSESVSGLYLATMSFSRDGSIYFPDRYGSHLLARVGGSDPESVMREFDVKDGYGMLFSVDETIFERNLGTRPGFLSTYYFDSRLSDSDVGEVAHMMARDGKIRSADFVKMRVYGDQRPKFGFPYGERMLMIDMADDKNHSIDKNHCERLRKHACRKGFAMYNLMSAPLLSVIK